jgi:hypothetical protein
MQELRFVAVSEDGSYAVLAVPGRSARFTLPIDERLRAVALGQTSRLAQYEIEVESPLRPKEIQTRIRAGETVEQIADAAGIPVERVRWFEGPVLAERAYIADQAQSASVRRQGDSAPGPRLGDIVSQRLTATGIDPDEAQWDSRKRGDGNWQVALTFPSGGRLHTAEWVFDARRRHASPDDDNASRLSLPEEEFTLPPLSAPGEATVTPLAPRLGAVSAAGGGHGGNGSVGGSVGGGSVGGGSVSAASVGGSSRFRQDRPAQPVSSAHAPTAPPAVSAPPPAAPPPAASQPVAPPPAAAPSEPARPASAPEPAAREPEPAPASEPEQVPEPEPVPDPTVVAQPEPARPTPAAETPVPPVASPAASTAPAAPASPAPGAPAAPASPAATAESPAAASAPETRSPSPQAPAAAQTPSRKAEPAAKTEPSPKQEPAAPGSRQGRKSRNRRSSVPSWDEIMLGSSRQPD